MDAHDRHQHITTPEWDILIHAGDYSMRGYDAEITRFYKWLNEQPAKYKISIQGNHEMGWEKDPKNGVEIARKECPNVILLNNEMVTIEGINIYGMPDTPWFYDWAYNRARNEPEMLKYHVPLMKNYTDNIPNNTDILVSHGPPYGILDELTNMNGVPKGQFVGCEDLLQAVNRVKPDLHIFGHIHCGHGQKHILGTSFYNVAVCDERYKPSNPITKIEYLTE